MVLERQENTQVKIFVTIPPSLFILHSPNGNRCIHWVPQGQHSVTQGFFSSSFHALYFVFYYIKPRSLIFQDLKKALQTHWLLLKHTQPFSFKNQPLLKTVFFILVCSEIHHISQQTWKGIRECAALNQEFFAPKSSMVAPLKNSNLIL